MTIGARAIGRTTPRRGLIWLGLAALVSVLSACGWLQPSWLTAGGHCGGDAATEEAAAWSNAALVPIVISSGEFQPMVIDLRRNRPYLLTIDNRDDVTRVFYAPDFLHTATIDGIRVAGEARDDGCPGQLLLPPLATAEIRLKPRRRGHFTLADTLVPLDVWGSGLGTIRVD